MGYQLLPSALTDADDDWMEQVRKTYYPKLHPYLQEVGGYGVGTVGEGQFVGVIAADEEVIEEELESLGFIRNPIACYKSTRKDDRESEGSWVLLHDADPGEFVDEGYQLHVTLMPRRDGKPGRELYAHHEPDWRQTPFKHLWPQKYPGAKWETEPAADYTRELVDDRTYFDVTDR